MVKVSTTRSVSRRLALAGAVKSAAINLNPQSAVDFMRKQVGTPQAAGALAAGAGGLLAGHAAGREGSGWSRILQGLLGAGLAYGGYRYFTDPAFRGTVNGYGRAAYDAVSPHLRAVADRVKPVLGTFMSNVVGGGAT